MHAAVLNGGHKAPGYRFSRGEHFKCVDVSFFPLLPKGTRLSMSTENTRYLKRRRHRRQKIKKLLERLKKPHDARERAKVIDKLWKVNPTVIPAEFTK